jgi:hypothetical protein
MGGWPNYAGKWIKRRWRGCEEHIILKDKWNDGVNHVQYYYLRKQAYDSNVVFRITT